jgi:predicted phosphodiesterase
MRIAVVSDIHGNLTAFEAVLADLRHTAPDLIFHGGDLADGGPGGAAIIDQIRGLGWPGVIGNTDEMLAVPETLEDFASRSPHLENLWTAVREMAAASRELLGEDRLAWLRRLPRLQTRDSMALVHASPASPWRAPGPEAADAEMESTYAPLAKPIIVYGHIHRRYIRSVGGMTIVNTGSVSLSYDGDPRASYLLLDDGAPEIRRVRYDVEQEIRTLTTLNFPHAEWIAKILRSASPQMP